MTVMYTYFIERNISFEEESYTFIENDEPGEVCINSSDLTGVIEVVIRPVMKEVDNPATGTIIVMISLILIIVS